MTGCRTQQAMENAAALYNVPRVKQYDYIPSLPIQPSHCNAGFYSEGWVTQIKA